MDASKHLKVGFAPKNPAGLTYEKHPDGYFSSNGIHEGNAASTEERVDFEKQPGVKGKGGAGGVIVVLLLIGAGGGAGYWYWKKRQSEQDTTDVRE